MNQAVLHAHRAKGSLFVRTSALVIMAAALTLAACSPAKTSQTTSAEAAKTPMIDGHPDLSGGWGAPQADEPVKTEGGHTFIQFPGAPGGAGPRSTDEPVYKPEFQTKVNDLSERRAYVDTNFKGANPGVPRLGIPLKIVQTKDEVIFFYEPEQGDYFRIIPVGPDAKHDPDADQSYMGDSIAHWDGDALVVESVGFVPEIWMTAGGGIHSDKMKVTERLTRTGDQLTWQATVDDPDMLAMPWQKKPVTRKLNNQPWIEQAPYHEIDSPLLRTNQHLGG